jgi:exodeoxyribonuclease VII large subunit
MENILTVSQFNELINVQLQTIGLVAVVGEITEKQITRNSGLLMTIKDDKTNAILKLSGFAPRVKGVNSVDVGMKIVATGVPQVYAPYGSFSLQVISLVPHGEGSLKAAFERLKQLLESKGYFAPERKRKLPAFVTKIALITADGSAAYIDFIKILKETQTGLDIDFYPAAVQGKSAVSEVVKAIQSISEKGNYDVVVLTRGGGSLEDLIAFNDEEVAEAVFASKIPVISAVGHERDTSISDLVADIVASTPSQAAYYLASHNDNFVQNYFDQLQSAENVLQNLLSQFDYSVKLATMENVIRNAINQMDFSDKLVIIQQNISNKIGMLKAKSESIQNLLDSYDPRKVIKRGYSVVHGEKGTIKSTKEVKLNDELSIRVIDGKIISQVKNIINN